MWRRVRQAFPGSRFDDVPAIPLLSSRPPSPPPPPSAQLDGRLAVTDLASRRCWRTLAKDHARLERPGSQTTEDIGIPYGGSRRYLHSLHSFVTTSPGPKYLIDRQQHEDSREGSARPGHASLRDEWTEYFASLGYPPNLTRWRASSSYVLNGLNVILLQTLCASRGTSRRGDS